VKSEELIIALNSRLGIAGLNEALTPTNTIITHSIKFYQRYIRTGTLASTSIEVTGQTYVFTTVIPSSIHSIYSLDTGQEVDDFDYVPPLLMGLGLGKYLVRYSIQADPDLAEFDVIPDLLEDLIFARYCKSINHALNIGKIEIPISLDTTSILEEGTSLEAETKALIIDQKSHPM